MNDIYVFLIRNDVWIYILCSLGLLWYLSELFRSQSALRQAMFGLEQESARATRNRALFFVLTFALIIGTVAYVNRQIAPTLPPSLLRPPTPTPDPLAPTEPPLTEEPEIEATPTSPVAPTVTLPGDQPVEPTAVLTGTVTPGTPAPLTVPTATPPILGCAPTAQISDPREGARVDGILNVFGTADTPEFAYYELDINGPQTNQRWASLLGRRVTQPVDDGFLGGNINLTQWESGSYLIRLTVVDEAEQITHQCVVNIMLATGS